MRNQDFYRNPAMTCPSCGEKGEVQCTDVADARLHFFTDEDGCDVENTHHLGPRIADCHCKNCDSKWLMLEDTCNDR